MNRFPFINRVIVILAASLIVTALQSCREKEAGSEEKRDAHVVAPGDPVPVLKKPASTSKKVNIRGVVKNAVEISEQSPVNIMHGKGQGSTFKFSAGVVAGHAPGPVVFSVESDEMVLTRLIVNPESETGWVEASVEVGSATDSLTISCDHPGRGAYLANPRFITNARELPPLYFILIDALRADALGAYGSDSGASPNLDRFAREGAVFERAHTSAPFTLTSVASIFTGMYPWQHRVLFAKDAGLVMHEDVPSLIEELRDAGYHTALFSGTYFFLSRNGLGKGFDHIDEVCAPLFFRKAADCLTPRVEEWVKRHADEPVFVYVHYVDPHAPYYAPDKFREKYVKGMEKPGHDDVALGQIEQFGRNREWWQFYRSPSAFDIRYLRQLYKGEVNYMDDRAGGLIASIRYAYEGRPHKPAILVTADHGEAFFEHGNMDHVADLHEPVMRVPLLLDGPGIPASVRVKGQARTMDFIPTLMDMASLEVPDWTSGRSLLPLLKGGDLSPAPAGALHFIKGRPEYAIVLWPWKILARPEDDEYELFNLEDDPAEENDLSEVEAEKLEALRGVLGDLLEKSTAATKSPDRMDPETRKRLDALGYIDD